MYERDGWYLFDGNRIAGPFDIEVLENVKTSSHTPNKLLITRQGFDQWYPIRQLDKWFQPTESNDLKREIEEFQREVERSASALAGLHPQKQSLQKVEPNTIATPAKTPSASKSSKRKGSSRKRNKGKKGKRPQAAQGAGAPVYQQKIQPSVVLNIDPAMSPAHNYMLLKGRLRLGDLRSPGYAALAHPILTLGIYPVLWFISAYREIYWHGLNQIRRPSIFIALGFAFPVLACWPAYYLAREVSKMEQQNQYRSIRPWLALCLGMIPPFALYYLQSAINDHWVLHVKNCG